MNRLFAVPLFLSLSWTKTFNNIMVHNKLIAPRHNHELITSSITSSPTQFSLS